MDGTKDPRDDVIRFYFIARCVRDINDPITPTDIPPHSGVIEPKDQKRLEELTEEVLGPKADRTAASPVNLGHGTFKGGTVYERSTRAHPVKPGSRCYTNAYSYQVPANIASPMAQSKYQGDLDDNLLLRRTINLVRPMTSPHAAPTC